MQRLSDLAPAGLAQIALGFKKFGLNELNHATDVQVDNGVVEWKVSRLDDVVDNESDLEPMGTRIPNDGGIDRAYGLDAKLLAQIGLVLIRESRQLVVVI